MNGKTNFIGYSQTLGLTERVSTTVTTNSNGSISTYDLNGNWGTPLNGWSSGTSLTYSTPISNSNSNNMIKQVKAAVFTVERNEDNKVVSAKFIKEVWVEVKNGCSLDLAVAKELDADYDPSTTVIREVYSVTF